ncbi:hypothetical protein B6A10_07355 [Flavobacterium sp. L1I52]|uniref:Uncharacterized protein n=1 Tax=Flavobacterium pokkalii TaxID=1940408 RepID=A0ABR7UQ70_9FLAO|nr:MULTISPECIES: hypothetical protein [Flavobacterium]KQB43785.1 hypothetical protein RCH33_273 [Flavobacterium daejeonense]MBD0724991.1 hypothetical protein [Flavobacterium pokkalii]
MTNSEKIRKVNELLIEVIKDEEHQSESSFNGLKDVVLSILADYWQNEREPAIFMENALIDLD